MSSRLYLPSGGTVPTISPGFVLGTGFTPAPIRVDMATTRQGTALTTRACSITGSYSSGLINKGAQQFIGPAMTAQTISGTFSMVLKVSDVDLMDAIPATDPPTFYLQIGVANAAGVMQGYLFNGVYFTYTATVGADGQGWNTTLDTRVITAKALTSYTCADGDRLVLTIGRRGDRGNTHNFGFVFGDPAATADHTLVAGQTMVGVPWIEFSGDLFGAVAPPIPSGSASGHTTFTGAASGTTARRGIAAGTALFTGLALGTALHTGAATGHTTWTGTASGVTPAVSTRTGSASGTTTWTGHAAGARTTKGSASGTVTFTGTASGVRTARGTATGSTTWTGTATGTAPAVGAKQGTATGHTTWGGAAAGTRVSRGTATGGTTWTGTAAGVRPVVGGKYGAASGSTLWTGSATGRRDPVGAATGVYTFTGTAAGATTRKGATAGAWTFTGTATGTNTVVPAHNITVTATLGPRRWEATLQPRRWEAHLDH